MSLAPFHPRTVHVKSGPYALVDFDRLMAPLVASWVPDAHTLFWLAPKTIPPLTAVKVVGWTGAGDCPLLLYEENEPEPLGYAELNPMLRSDGHLWIGHCLIRPDRRQEGLGHRIVDMLLEEAFVNCRASAVRLVVFPDNAPAIRCYRTAGFVHIHEQVKFAPSTGKHHCMLEMRIDAPRYAQQKRRHETANPPRPHMPPS